MAAVALLLLLRDPISDNLLEGGATLYWVLVVALVGFGAAFFARGFLAGRRQFGLYASLLVIQGTARLAFALAVAVGIADGIEAVALGICAGSASRRSRRSPKPPRASSPQGERDHRDSGQRRGADPQCHRLDPVRDPDRDRKRERESRGPLDHQQAGVEPELAPAGEEPAGEESCSEADQGDDQYPVQRRPALEQVVGDRVAKQQQQGDGGQRERRLDQCGDPEHVARVLADLLALGERPREQLLDRPEQGRGGDEDHTDQSTTISP